MLRGNSADYIRSIYEENENYSTDLWLKPCCNELSGQQFSLLYQTNSKFLNATQSPKITHMAHSCPFNVCMYGIIMLYFTIIVVTQGRLLHAQLRRQIFMKWLLQQITISHFIAFLGSWDEMSSAKSVECATTKVLHRERMLNACLLISTT